MNFEQAEAFAYEGNVLYISKKKQLEFLISLLQISDEEKFALNKGMNDFAMIAASRSVAYIAWGLNKNGYDLKDLTNGLTNEDLEF